MIETIHKQMILLTHEEVADGIWRMRLQSESILDIHAGQFAHLRVNGFLLRRPISVCDWESDSRVLTLMYQVVGKGTAAMTQWPIGEQVSMLVPLGNGYDFSDVGKVVLAGGGMGVAPLLLAARQLRAAGREVLSFLGFRNAGLAYGIDELRQYGSVYVATEDGSLGVKGYVTTLLQEYCAGNKKTSVWACGPKPMLKALRGLDVPVQVSLEERMGCGVGGCLVCNCAIWENGEKRYKRVCADGPVFRLEQVVWEDEV